MATRHSEKEVFEFMVGDFTTAWNAVANTTQSVAPNRCNFLFALLAAVFLEWCSRLCLSDKTGTALANFKTEIQKINLKYFTVLPGIIKPKPEGEFVIPGEDSGGSKILLVALWDLIRNGNAHEYQDILVDLGGKHWSLGILPASEGQTLDVVEAQRASVKHLSFQIDADGDLQLIVHPALLFTDLKDAAIAAGLLSRTPRLTVAPLVRPRPPRQQGKKAPSLPLYDFDVPSLESKLTAAGHTKLP